MTYKQILRRRAKKSTQTKVIGKFGAHHVLHSPLFTEKAQKQGENLNKYHFRVHREANKNDVKRAVESIYNVEVQKVNIQNVPAKGRANRKKVRSAYKKAVITLPKEQKIELVG